MKITSFNPCIITKDAESGGPALRLPLPHALPLRDRTLRRGGTRAEIH